MRHRQLIVVVAVVVTAIFPVAAPALAQSARATGQVRDTDGHPIRGATVKAINPNGHPQQITSASDNKGRWAMIGLTSGEWQFVVEAPGFFAQKATSLVRIAASAPMVFTLARDPGPIPGALEKNVVQQVGEANTLRDQGRYDQAISVYQEIRTRNPKLTSINFVMADAYRRKAAQEANPTTRKSLLDLAIESYNEVLKSDANNPRALQELESTRAEQSAVSGLNQ